MKKMKLLCLLALVTTFASAQTTFDLDWAIGEAGQALTVEPGDTVRWTWMDGLPHTVTSLGGSTETFDSGSITGSGMQYSYTFSSVGVNPYECSFHPGSMNGTITVEQLASIGDKFRKNISFYPNPVQDILKVTSLFELDSYQVYNVLGKIVLQGAATGNITEIEMSSLQSGMYFVNAKSGDMEASFKVNKQ